MPWCPQCEAEYQEGYTECKDCKVPLVDKLEEADILYENFFQAEDSKIAEKLVKFFEYSELPCELSYDEDSELYIVSIPPEYEKDARKLYQAFYSVEQELVIKEAYKKAVSEFEASEGNTEDSSVPSDSDALDESSDSEKDFSEKDEEETEVLSIDNLSDDEDDNGVYVMKSDEYNDLAGTVFIFLFFGVAGLIFVILNVTNILNLFNGWLPNSVMGILFLAFIYVALTTNHKAKKVRSEIEIENKMTEQINAWLNENVTESFLASLQNDNISEEANYIKNLEIIKDMLLKEFGSQNRAYLDRLIDEFYSKNFDQE